MDLNERDRAMLRLNHSNGNGKAATFDTTERRIVSRAAVAWKVIGWIVAATVFAVTTYQGVIARADRADDRIEQLQRDVESLHDTKQSKEAAEGDKRELTRWLGEFEKRMDERFDSLKDEIRQSRRGR